MQTKSLLVVLLHASQVLAYGYADNQRPAQKDDDQVAELFPEPDLDIISPAFLSPETVPDAFADNFAPPTDTAGSATFLKQLAKRNPWIHYHEPDFTSEEKRVLPYVYVSKTRKDIASKPSGNKLRIWLQAGVHGDEPSGSQALLALVGKLNEDKKWASSVLDKVDIVVLPIYNADGVQYFQRVFASGFDPNRDNSALQRRQSRDIKRLMSKFDPHILLDAHEYTASSLIANKYLKSQDLQFSAAKNPNIRHEIRSLSEGLFTNSVWSALNKAGHRTSVYYTTSTSGGDITLTEPGSISRPAHSSAGLGQRLAFLSETRGIRLGDQHFKRRVYSNLLTAETIIRIAVQSKDLVYRTIEDARSKFIESNDEIVVQDKSRSTDITIELIEAETGDLVDVPVKFNNNTPTEVTLLRERPEAYIFPAVWEDVADRLRVHGVEVEVLGKEFRGTVDTLTVTDVTLASSKFQGIVESSVTTEPGKREVRIPAGGYRVSTRQKNAAYALITLEPENAASFVTYNIIPLEEGEEYPVFRIF